MQDDAPTAPSIDPSRMSAPAGTETRETDPLVQTWLDRVNAARKHWGKLRKRMRHNRKVVRGINDKVEPETPDWNEHRANLIQSTLTVVLSRVYAKNPEMSAEPVNKARDLRLFADTVTNVTQNMLEAAGLKKKAKATVRAAMTCSFGVAKVMYQRVTAGEADPIIRQRIQDSQDNIQRIEQLLAKVEDEAQRAQHETAKRELEEALAGLRAQSEVVAAEGLVIDRTPPDRLLVDPAVEDVWEYETADWMAEEIPMRRSKAQALFPGLDLKQATTHKVSGESAQGDAPRPVFGGGQGTTADDPLVMVIEVWSRADNRVFTLVDGCNKQFARAPYTPEKTGERWWPYFLLPFQSVDGEFVAQSLVDVLEKLQKEHNDTRDKFAELRRQYRPHYVASADLKDKSIQKKQMADLGEVVTIDTGGQPLNSVIQPGVNLQADPQMFDTSQIRNDWEMVSGLQDAARSIVVQPKTATEAAISDQSLAARVAEFRDQVEDWLTEIAQYASELCLLNMTPAQVETIMGAPTETAEPAPEDTTAALDAIAGGMPPPPPAVVPTYMWPGAGMPEASPETVFNLVAIKIRAGSTAAPNKLQAQENWNRALQLLMPMIDKIRQIEMAGGDATPERELVKETAARFDETIDVDRFLPPKPQPAPAAPALPGMGAPAMAAAPGGLPMPDPAAVPPGMPADAFPPAPLQ